MRHRIALLCLIVPLFAACQRGTADHSANESSGPITSSELLSRIESGTAPVVLDVRRQEEFDEGHVQGAVLIPYDEIEARHEEQGWSRDEEIVVYCRSGRRAGIAEEFLRGAGYTRIRHLEGDMLAWKEQDLPLVTR